MFVVESNENDARRRPNEKLTRREPPGKSGHGLDAQTARRDLGDERAEHGAKKGTREESGRGKKEAAKAKKGCERREA